MVDIFEKYKLWTTTVIVDIHYTAITLGRPANQGQQSEKRITILIAQCASVLAWSYLVGCWPAQLV